MDVLSLDQTGWNQTLELIHGCPMPGSFSPVARKVPVVTDAWGFFSSPAEIIDAEPDWYDFLTSRAVATSSSGRSSLVTKNHATGYDGS